MSKELIRISEILSDDLPLEEKYSRVRSLANSIVPITPYDEPKLSQDSVDLDTLREGQMTHLIMKLSVFGQKQYCFPKFFKFEDWRDTCEAGLNLIQKMIQESQLEPRQMPEYEEFDRLMRDKSHQLYLDQLAGKYPPEFFEPGG
jgi:hypothetical protein